MLGAQSDLDWAELNQISDSRIERLWHIWIWGPIFHLFRFGRDLETEKTKPSRTVVVVSSDSESLRPCQTLQKHVSLRLRDSGCSGRISTTACPTTTSFAPLIPVSPPLLSFPIDYIYNTTVLTSSMTHCNFA